MDEVLSQSEIDSLLQAVSSGELDTEQAKQEEKEEQDINKYDFKRPNKYSKDQLRTLQLIHDNFSRVISNFLSAYLRANIKVEIASVDQTTYEDFIVSISTPTLITMFKIKPKDETALMVTNSGFLFPIIDLVFGGPGETSSSNRELTDIEINVMRKLNNKILDHLAYAWEDVYQIEPEIDSLETNPQFSQLYSPTETVAVVTMSTEVQGQESLINLCLPFIALESIISKLSAQYWFASSAAFDKEEVQPLLINKLEKAEVDLSVVLGSTSLSVREFLQLNKDDVIPLENTVNEDIDLWVEERKKFKVQPGIVGRRKGVYIKTPLKRSAAIDSKGGE